VLELDQVIGIRPELLRAILPYVTVHSRPAGTDRRTAAPVLLAALAGDEPARAAQLSRSTIEQAREGVSAIAAEFLAQSIARTLLIRADVRTAAGGAFAQEAIVELTGSAPLDVLLEWRRSDNRFGRGLWLGCPPAQ
jgi:general secretion pathway protein K